MCPLHKEAAPISCSSNVFCEDCITDPFPCRWCVLSGEDVLQTQQTHHPVYSKFMDAVDARSRRIGSVGLYSQTASESSTSVVGGYCVSYHLNSDVPTCPLGQPLAGVCPNVSLDRPSQDSTISSGIMLLAAGLPLGRVQVGCIITVAVCFTTLLAVCSGSIQKRKRV